ncbi:PXA domain-containing protein [Russula earlei]|uniref:PXA domain-containing protein n=1 Tax=Russula earlei TaxID=71964 RepID=A0ACC0UM59_9AGAM|nr:PXA domain-containing protein [Russula earlei]
MATSFSQPLPSAERAPSINSSSSKTIAPGHSTLSLTDRLLFPHLAPSSPRPPLLQSSSTYPPLDAELYELIALALRAYVNPWWTKITRYDKELLVDLTRILSSVLRALEARALAADLSALIYHDVPTVLTQHCADYRVAARKLGTSYAAAGSASLPMLFHGQQQHVGVSVDGKIDEVYVRAAVDVVLKACLSPEDWDPEAERYLIREIIVKTVCVDIVPRVTQPWFLHSTVLAYLGPADEPPRPPDTPRSNTNSSLVPSLHTIIVSFLSAVQAISSTALYMIHIYKRTLHTIKSVHNSPPYVPLQSTTIPTPLVPRETSAAPSPPIPENSYMTSVPSPSQSVVTSLSSGPNNRGTPPPTPPSPIRAPPHNLARPSLLLIAELLSLSTRFSGAALVFLSDALISAFASFFDRLLPLFLYTTVLTPAQITALVSAAKNSLFPNGYPAQSPPDPTPEEQTVLRSDVLRRLAQLIPGALAPLLLGPAPSARERTLSALLDPFDEQACNAHLFMLIFDLALLALFPEMAVGATDSGVGNP